MIEAEPLRARKLSELKDSPLLLVLDQVTDPHNVGAIMRSAVAFGAGALITTSRHSPQETGVLAKAASGALEMISHIEVRNLAEAIEELHSLGFQTIGLDSEGPQEMEATLSGGRIAPGTGCRRQRPASKDARNSHRACPPRHAGRNQVAQRIECGCNLALCC